MGACLFTSCRRNGVSRTHEEIAGMVRVSTRSLCKAIVRFDDAATAEHPIMLTQLSLAERMMNGLAFTEIQRHEVLAKIRSIFKSPDEELEHTPKVVVAGVIASILLRHSPGKSTLKEFAKHSGVSAVSIQKVMGKL
jgi:transcription initiation factor TFIIIB Brf1 subunit/transcription initiation factor TFIIB